MESLNASDFKTRVFAILEQVSRTGKGITILKRGKPIAQLLPTKREEPGFLQFTLKGTVEILGNIIEPAVAASEWEAEKATR